MCSESVKKARQNPKLSLCKYIMGEASEIEALATELRPHLEKIAETFFHREGNGGAERLMSVFRRALLMHSEGRVDLINDAPAEVLFAVDNSFDRGNNPEARRLMNEGLGVLGLDGLSS